MGKFTLLGLSKTGGFFTVLATPPVIDIIAATKVLADKLSVSHGQESAAQLMDGMVEVLQSFRQQTYKVRKSNLSKSHGVLSRVCGRILLSRFFLQIKVTRQ